MIEEDNVGSLSLERLKGNPGEVSLDRLYEVLDQLITSEAQKQNTSPNELIRVVHNGKVTWVTAQQAGLYLRSDSADEEEEQLRDNVERALKGHAKLLHQELWVLLAIAQGTFKDLRNQGLFESQEARKIEPSLRRREDEIRDTFTQLYEVEGRIAAARERQPLLAEYEARMGQLLNLQQVGKLDEARTLAIQLAAGKKRYVLLSRVLEPDVNTAYFYRLNSQKTKKKILTVQQTMCLKKEGSLGLHIEELQSHMETVKGQMAHAEATMAGDATQAEIISKAQDKLLKTDQEMQQVHGELHAVKAEARVLRKQAKETDMVIEHIATDILKDPSISVDVQSQVRSIEQRRKQQPVKAPSAPKRTGGIRMSTVDRRQ